MIIFFTKQKKKTHFKIDLILNVININLQSLKYSKKIDQPTLNTKINVMERISTKFQIMFPKNCMKFNIKIKSCFERQNDG